jgi:hypothetical protein
MHRFTHPEYSTYVHTAGGRALRRLDSERPCADPSAEHHRRHLVHLEALQDLHIPAVTHADLASLCGGSRENVTRILTEWQRRGLVQRDGHRYVLKEGANKRLRVIVQDVKTLEDAVEILVREEP